MCRITRSYKTSWAGMSSLAADAFTDALVSIPPEDWCRTWAADRTIMLRMTSKRVKEVVDKVKPPVIVRLSRRFWGDWRNDTVEQRLRRILAQLAAMHERCSISELELPRCALRQMYGVWISDPKAFGAEGAGMVAGVLAQCPALAHLNLSHNEIGANGAGRLAGVLTQCRALAHLNLSGNRLGDDGAGMLAAMLAQCPALAHLDLSRNDISADGAERLAGVLAQCPALAHLNLSHNRLGVHGAGRLAGVLAQCRALTHIDLSNNEIRADGAGTLGRSPFLSSVTCGFILYFMWLYSLLCYLGVIRCYFDVIRTGKCFIVDESSPPGHWPCKYLFF